MELLTAKEAVAWAAELGTEHGVIGSVPFITDDTRLTDYATTEAYLSYVMWDDGGAQLMDALGVEDVEEFGFEEARAAVGAYCDAYSAAVNG